MVQRLYKSFTIFLIGVWININISGSEGMCNHTNFPKGWNDTKLTMTDRWTNTAIEAANIYRRKHGVPVLERSETLCHLAQNWANKLADAETQPNNSDFGCGETLWIHADKIYNIYPSDIIDAWYVEGEAYDFEKGGPKETYVFKNIDHFTQLVWKDSKYICIALAKIHDGNVTYGVAEYWPKGNVMDADAHANEVNKNYINNILPLSNKALICLANKVVLIQWIFLGFITGQYIIININTPYI